MMVSFEFQFYLSVNGTGMKTDFACIAPLNSRVVPNAGSIEVRIVSATEVAKNKGEEEDEQFEFESPDASVNDHGAISYLEGDLNNTIGIR